MDLNELQSVQSRERQTDSLQQLRASFYRDAADYIGDLEAERDAAAERADDPWNAPEVGRLNDDIDTAKDTVEAIYERRVGKIVKMASLAAADMPTDDEGLTDEEQNLFDQLVTAIEQNREGVFAILDGEDPPVEPTTAGPVESGAAVESGTASEPDRVGEPERTADTATATDVGSSADTAPADTPAEASDGRHEVPPDVRDPADGSPIADSPTDETSTEEAPGDEQPTDDQHVGAADLMGGDSAGADAGPASTDPADTDPADTGGSQTGRTETGRTETGRTETGSDPQSSEPASKRSGQAVRDGGAVETGAADSTESPDGTQSPADAGVSPDATPGGSIDAGTDDAARSPRSTGDPGTDGTSGTEAVGDGTDGETTTITRSMVRITDDVGPIYGVEGREYDLTANDVVTLPEPNVGPLLEQGAAERLD